jgi:pimeloyl-ACP methyl ester carboxylesterase
VTPRTAPLLTPPDPALEPESLLVTVDSGERLHVLDWGGPASPRSAEVRPALLLLHGLQATAWAWAPIARRVAGSLRVLVPDLRGHGLSEAPRGGYDLESLAFDVLTVASAAGYGGDVGGPPVVVAGHGLGALVAGAAALLRPGSVAGLALVDAGWETLAEATGMDVDEFLRSLAEPPEVLGSMGAYLADRRDYDPASWDADQERAARAAVDEKYQGRVVPVVRRFALAGCVRGMFEYRPETTFAGVAGPLLVLVAEAGGADDEAALERRHALQDQLDLRARAGLAPARVVRYAGVGHNLMRYRPAELSAELLALVVEGPNR